MANSQFILVGFLLFVGFQFLQKLIKKLTFKPFQMPLLVQSDYIKNPQKQDNQTLQVIECFATWCAPCRNMIPHLNKLAKAHPDVFVISVSSEKRDVVEKFMENNPMNYNVAAGSLHQEIMKKCGAMGIPHSCLFMHKMLIWQGHPMNLEAQIVKYKQILNAGEKSE
ncbi:FixW_protein [Hexamita inflata]|uniref:Putative n=1 Tax=Hexamita inflata TaxID=28002 RepID=A0AA86QIM8_9EUKA|nr:FixW protein [Hexamita inflata]